MISVRNPSTYKSILFGGFEDPLMTKLMTFFFFKESFKFQEQGYLLFFCMINALRIKERMLGE